MMAFLTDPALWHWTSRIWFVVLPLLVVGLWLRPKPFAARQLWFLAACFVLLMAFVSPIGVLARGYLFSAHMIQHLLLLLIIPLCLMLSLPQGAFASIAESPRMMSLRKWFAHPMLGWVLGLGAMWFWHVPSLCSAATQSDLLGVIRSATFLLAGLAFWWPIYAPLEKYRLDPLTSVVYLFSACLGCTLLGIYITFTTVSVCPAFANPVDRIGILTAIYQAGLSPSVDQQLGGLLMWVPPCSLYVCAIVSVLCRWYSAESSILETSGPNDKNLPEASA
ncbi:cytochrome c oxidase assembly protein [Bremerella cremea]|uniref:cytochrome c oxidase assembly protein n=1 Tax=Bremerella cremea TaxID=1031537 RepID=UPI0031E9201B